MIEQASIRQLAAEAARSVREGTLNMRHLLGLSHREMQALAEAAHQLRRKGDLQGAAGIWGLLLSCEPLNPTYWKALAQIEQRLGNHALAVTCFEAVALLQDPHDDMAEQQARSLGALGIERSVP
jgi:tetratricopeptide (TPR) repeat protein